MCVCICTCAVRCNGCMGDIICYVLFREEVDCSGLTGEPHRASGCTAYVCRPAEEEGVVSHCIYVCIYVYKCVYM